MTKTGRPSIWDEHAPEMARLYTEEGLSRGQIARQYDTSVQTVTRMLTKLDVPLEGRIGAKAEITQERRIEINAKISESRKGKGTGRRRQREKRICEECGNIYEANTTTQRFCSRSCRNVWQGRVGREQAQEEYRLHPKLCPCGETIPFEFRHTNQYCSLECRKKYQAKRQADPANHITFDCQNCGKSTTRRKNFGYAKYCSNACASKHTKTKHHVVLKDSDVVLDSSWEALFWGLCGFLKVPIERHDRNTGIAWRTEGDGWYAPDFWLPGLELAVEVKGHQRPDDEQKWTAYREQHGKLVVIDGQLLQDLRAAPTGRFLSLLKDS